MSKGPMVQLCLCKDIGTSGLGVVFKVCFGSDIVELPSLIGVHSASVQDMLIILPKIHPFPSSAGCSGV